MNQVIHVTEAELVEVSSHDIELYQAKRNPVAIYLFSLESALSRATMLSYFKQIVRMINDLKPGEPVDVFSFPWEKIDRMELQTIIAKLRGNGMAPETIKTYMAAVRGVLAEAFELKLIDAAHLERIRRVKRPKGSRISRGRSLTKPEAYELLDSCNENAIGIRDKAILSLLFACGLRRSELAKIEYRHYSASNGSITITGKGNKEREAFLTESATQNLEAWLKVRGHEEGALFVRIKKGDVLNSLTFNNGTTPAPNLLTSQAIYYILKKKQLELGMEKFSPHDLRRTLATTLLSLGEDLITVRDVLGHSSINTTQRYDMRGRDRVKTAVNRSGF
ncbi:tyrosine-type recombinase/integrase [Thiomicrorhabdus aquaedulcis]|uniref:tyrosine-type recombinase/integrase n=1 Tax=Thiomicrorhabdus aquaedulcis TaxID=2211106 RepID=UPI000FD6E732|nr:tyrosine-type recombinase/integrase [Thiomicrorhabdus aquaedulcis]